MGETIVQMYGGPSTDTDDVSAFDVPEDGLIKGYMMDLQAPSMVAGKEMQAEISFLSTSQFTTNDARGLIGRCSMATNTVSTNGGGNAQGYATQKFDKGITVAAGERVHLHFETSDSVLCRIHVLLIFEFKGGVRAARRR